MTCYARPLALLALVIAVAMLAVGRFGSVAAMVTVLAAAGLVSVLAGLLISRVTRSRAASGACTTCRHPCQGRPVVFIDETSLTVPPRWPDSPATTAGQDKLARLIATARQ